MITIPKEQQEANKQGVLALWSRLDPSGVALPELETFKRWLCDSDFFTAPCSTKFHLACKGGLALHSLNVYALLQEKVTRYSIAVPDSSIIICALGHDLCKVGFYKPDEEPPSSAQVKYLYDLVTSEERLGLGREGTMTKAWASNLIGWVKEGRKGNRPPRDAAYIVDDQLPMGHGEKSVSILQDFFKLTDEEKLAIRWHMQAFDAGIHFSYPSGFPFRKAADEYPLVTLLFTADYEASQILEREVE